jgi:hypothetical protein
MNFKFEKILCIKTKDFKKEMLKLGFAEINIKTIIMNNTNAFNIPIEKRILKAKTSQVDELDEIYNIIIELLENNACEYFKFI